MEVKKIGFGSQIAYVRCLFEKSPPWRRNFKRTLMPCLRTNTQIYIGKKSNELAGFLKRNFDRYALGKRVK